MSFVLEKVRGSFRCKVLLMFSVTCSLMLSAGVAFSARHALVIGNGNYDYAPLKNPVNDARAMYRALVDVDFDVTLVKNGNKREMERAVKRFSSKLRKYDEALFFYAGHAIQVKNENYLIPLDVSVEHDVDVKKNFIKVTEIINEMQASNMSIVVLDACRTNPFSNYYVSDAGLLTRSSRGIGIRPISGLAPTKRAMGTLIAYSTDIGNVALDGDRGNSVFTENLVKYMKVPGLPLENVFKKVRVAVARATNKRQVPWDSSSITGDFYFVKPEDRVIVKKERRILVPSF